MLLTALLAAAHARCMLFQTPTADGVHVRVEATAEPVRCRTLSLASDGPVSVRARYVDPTARVHVLRGPHLRMLPGGGWEIGVPELAAGGAIEVDATLSGRKVAITLGPAEPPPRPLFREESRSVMLDARHPAWGFADPELSRTRVELRVELPEGGLVPLPPGATVLDAGGLVPVPSGLAGTGAHTLRYEVAGAAPQDVVILPPGRFRLSSPGVTWVATGSPGVTVQVATDTVTADAPRGGTLRYRAVEVGGEGVIPDVATYVAGLDWRFARLSLPEPAVPVRLRNERDRDVLLGNLYAEARALVAASLPGADPLRPRQLNAAWRSGWATPVERGLILHRFLGQEKFEAEWALTGEHADAATLTGFDTALVRVTHGGETVWLDPACGACRMGEISTARLGKVAIGAAPEIPAAAGRLVRRLRITGDRFEVAFEATGAAALWLREVVHGQEAERRVSRLAEALGMRDATLVSSVGLDARGAAVSLALTSTQAPRDPFPPDETPWSGGWGDAVEEPAD